MNQSTATPTTFTPYQYQPYSLRIKRTPQPDGTFTYQHPVAKTKVETNQDSLFEFLTLSLCKFQMVVDLLDEDDYEKFGFIFMSLLRETEKSYHEALHHIEQNIGDIQLTQISHNQAPYITDTVIDATIKNIEVN